MNDLDLQARLRSSKVPERSEEYWDEFPSRVRFELRRHGHAAIARRPWRIRFAWVFDLALTSAIVIICIHLQVFQTASDAVTRHRHSLRAELARLDAGAHRLMLNTDGMGYLLADAN